MSTEIDRTNALTQLALGTLPLEQRRALVQQGLKDPQLARELKLALRLADESADLTRDWVRVASQSSQDAAVGWRRPLAGMVASLAVAAAVMLVPWQSNTPPSITTVALSEQMPAMPALPDRIGNGSFEAASVDSIGSGSFE